MSTLSVSDIRPVSTLERVESTILPSLHALPFYDFDLRASHARTLLPAALASVPFGFVLVRVRVRVLTQATKAGIRGLAGSRDFFGFILFFLCLRSAAGVRVRLLLLLVTQHATRFSQLELLISFWSRSRYHPNYDRNGASALHRTWIMAAEITPIKVLYSIWHMNGCSRLQIECARISHNQIESEVRQSIRSPLQGRSVSASQKAAR